MAAKGKTSKGRAKGKGKKGRPKGVNQQLVKALAHELRVEILTILNERMASPNELAKELNEGLSQVSYHVKVLKDYDCIELVKTEPRRGAVEHYYRASARPYLSDSDWRQLPDSVREGMSADLMQMVLDDVTAALEAGTVDAHKDRHMSRTPLLLDAKGWKALGKLLGSTLEQVIEIQTESTDRLAGSEEAPMEVMVAMIGVETPGGRQAAAKGSAKTGRAKGKAKAKSKK
ncbi:MAG TPA: winged helix-turn-helix domain-containing protein [Solirubrobacterales bacterium]|nr:winged helix-turn-helix domain-containing protein [Solirubrobacterales bacterium]